MAKEQGLELKVGVFVLTGIALFVGMLLSLDVLYLKPGFELRVLFHNATGLEEGAPVRLAGVPIGNVEKINIFKNESGETQIDVRSHIRRDVLIDRDSLVQISAEGLLGEKYLEIRPGSPDAPALTEAETIIGRDPITMTEVANTGQRVVRKLESSVDILNEMIGDPRFQTKIKNNVDDIGIMINEMRIMTASLNTVLQRLEKGEGTIGKLLTEEAIYDDVKELVRDIKEHPWKLLKKDRSRR